MIQPTKNPTGVYLGSVEGILTAPESTKDLLKSTSGLLKSTSGLLKSTSGLLWVYLG